MLKFNENRKKYTSYVLLPNGEMLPVILDTGAMVTTLSFDAIVTLLRCEREELKTFVEGHSCTNLQGVDEVRHIAAPCYFRNAIIGDIHLERFYFMLSADINTSVLGFDFIKACTLNKLIDDGVTVTEFDHGCYTSTFVKSAGNVMPQELFGLAVAFDPVTWYKQLPAEYKDKLHQYSIPLYTVLNVNQYLDEFDGILAGFRAQYNV